MHSFVLAALLGVVEGITEFLPISSTAHLRIAQHWLGLALDDEFWKLFAILIQLGAILSVVVVYWSRLVDITLAFLRRETPWQKSPVTLILVAFFCTALPAFALKKVIGANLESLTIISGSLFVGGLAMLVVEYFCHSGRISQLAQMGLPRAAFVGLVQVLSAVFPGTSRSMCTIAAGQVVGLTRATALDFSFLVSIPVMFAATLYDLYKYRKEASIPLRAEQWQTLGIGFVISFIVAYVVVLWFLAFVRKRGFSWFALYRILLAGIVFYFG